MIHQAFNNSEEKLLEWKNKPLVHEDYFEKLPICIMQRIQMDREFKSMDTTSFVSAKTDRKLNQIWAYISGIAAIFIVALGYIIFHQQSNEKPIASAQNHEQPNNKKNTIEISKIEPEKITISSQQDSLAEDKNSTAINPSFEMTLNTISDEDLEAINWELNNEEMF